MNWRKWLWIGFLFGPFGCEGPEFTTVYPDAETGASEVTYALASSSTTTDPPSSSSSSSRSTTASTTTETSSTTSTVIVVTVTSTSAGCATLYGQCGGMGWSGPTTCCSGAGTCHLESFYFSQCIIP